MTGRFINRGYQRKADEKSKFKWKFRRKCKTDELKMKTGCPEGGCGDASAFSKFSRGGESFCGNFTC